MARDVLALARDTEGALANRDARRARAIVEGDRAIDRQYRRVRKRLEQQIRTDAARLHAWLQFVGLARNLERIADHARDIAQMIVYLEEGIFIRHKLDPPPGSP